MFPHHPEALDGEFKGFEVFGLAGLDCGEVVQTGCHEWSVVVGAVEVDQTLFENVLSLLEITESMFNKVVPEESGADDNGKVHSESICFGMFEMIQYS